MIEENPPRLRLPLFERSRPLTLAEIVGNGASVLAFRAWGKSWEAQSGPPRLRAALLTGPPGVGKTTAAHALAREMGWTLVELNASDARNQHSIEQVAGRASMSHSLSGDAPRSAHGRSRVLILLDEADCLSGRASEEGTRRPTPAPLREFLQGRYGSLEALAKAWGLGGEKSPPPFPDWSSVPGSPGRSAWARLPAARRDISDWQASTARVDSGDRGGLGAIARLVRETRQPIVLTANDPSSLTRYSPIFRTAVARIAFEPVAPSEVREAVHRVAALERLTVEDTALEAIVQRSRGDLRAAMNDLEAIAALPSGASSGQVLSPRDTAREISEYVAEVLSHPRFYRGAEVRDRLDATPEDLYPWVEENLPRVAPDAIRRYVAFETLGEADRMLFRARRFRVYALWSFATETMTGGVALDLEASGYGPSAAAFPVILGEMGRTRMARALRSSILTKLGRGVHLSRRKASEASFPFVEESFRRLRRSDCTAAELDRGRQLARELELTSDETAFLLGVEPDSALVRQLLQPTTEPTLEPEGESAQSSATADEAPGSRTATPRARRQRLLREF